jgi:6-phosphogluconate dehydrogenase
MKIGVIGLGRMGSGIALRLIEHGHEAIGFDLNATLAQVSQAAGIKVVATLEELPTLVNIFWLMIPQGAPVDAVIKTLLPHLKAGDIIIDGGNSNFHDSIRHAKLLAEKSIYFLDCGTSGGLLGREIGYCLMVGGDRQAYEKVKPALEIIAAPNALGHVGPSGAGHYVKMVHNGIEYALLEAYAEGFHLIREGSYKNDHLDLEEITRIWSHGSVIRSWILDLSHDVFKKDQTLDTISGEIQDNGTGAWTVDDAHEHKVPVPLIEMSLENRVWSRKTGGNYATKMVAMLRNKFGGHTVTKKDEK